MITGLGVLGWGVGGIEAEAACSASRSSMLTRRLSASSSMGVARGFDRDRPRAHRHADFAKPGRRRQIRRILRRWVSTCPLPRSCATIANMAPEYGATIGFFPVDEETLNYMRFCRAACGLLVDLVEAYTKEQGLWPTTRTRRGSAVAESVEIDFDDGRPSERRAEASAGSRGASHDVKKGFRSAVGCFGRKSERAPRRARGSLGQEASAEGAHARKTRVDGDEDRVPPPKNSRPGHAIAVMDDQSARFTAPSSSPPSPAARTPRTRAVLVAAGLVAKKAVERGLSVQPWVKTSLAPGSLVVTDYLANEPACRTTSTSWASTSSATAARRASAIPARCPTRSRQPWPR